MEYWWEGSTPTAMPSTSTSDIVGQHNKMRGVTFGASLTKCRWILYSSALHKLHCTVESES